MIRIVRNKLSLVSTTGFRRVSGGRTVAAAAVTGARGMTKRGFARLPGCGDAGRTELAGRLLASQGKLAEDVLRGHAAAPRPARHRRQQERRRDQAGLTFAIGPGPPPAI